MVNNDKKEGVFVLILFIVVAVLLIGLGIESFLYFEKNGHMRYGGNIQPVVILDDLSEEENGKQE